MLIRKLRWAGLGEKAEQLGKGLEQRAVTDRVVPIQNGRTNTNEVQGPAHRRCKYAS